MLIATAALLLAPSLRAQLTEAEKTQLNFLKEEEKLARDVYETLGTEWALPVFTNIARSEQTHMNLVDTALATFDLPDPATASRGTFNNPTLQSLYDRLVSVGATSLRSALGVGEFIEIIDIKDLDALIASSTNPTLVDVASRLRSGSYNHLAAFQRQLDMLPATFPLNAAIPRLVNMSVRGSIGNGDAVLIGGFVVEGAESLSIALAARGPSLKDYGIVNAAQDPAIEVYQGETLIASNRAWDDDPSAARLASVPMPPLMSVEAGMVLDLGPGIYTWIVRDHGTGGVGLMEIYDVSAPDDEARLINLSARGLNGTGEEQLIAGLVARGDGSLPLVVRTLGPSLESFGVAGFLSNPDLELHENSTPLTLVESWISAEVLGVVSTNLWPGDLREAMTVMQQISGTTTVHVSTPDSETGIVLLDVTVLDPR